MNYDEAVQTLGFKPGEPFEGHLPLLREAEERLGELAGEAEGELEVAYQKKRTELQDALAAIDSQETDLDAPPPLKKDGGRKFRFVLSILLVALLVAGGWWGSLWIEENERRITAEQIQRLLAAGSIAVENRRWPEATAKFEAVLALSPGHEGGTTGLERIEEGKLAERRQQVAYLVGVAAAAVESREWDKAEKTLEELAELEPDHETLAPTGKRIVDGRIYDRIVQFIEMAERAIQDEKWEELSANAKGLSELAPNHVDLPRYRELAAEGIKLMTEKKRRARELYDEAVALDVGLYSAAAVEKVREALRLDRQAEYAALYDKLSGYQRVLKVPEEFATIGAALAMARDKDSIRVAAGTYRETLVIDHAVNLEGAGAGETVVEFAAGEGSVVTLSSQVKGARLAGLTLRQTGFLHTEQRFPVVAVGGGQVAIEDCRVQKGSGHGIAVLEGAQARLDRVEVIECGWDGLAVYGEGSRAHAESCRFEGNLHHGIDAWDGGAVQVVKSTSAKNGLAGVVLMSAGQDSLIEGSTLDANREVGLMVSHAAAVRVLGNKVTANLLGGIVVRDLGSKASLERNEVAGNEKAGVVVDRNSVVTAFTDNVVKDNKGAQVDLKAVMAERKPEEKE